MAELIMTEEAGTPSTPSGGNWKIYPKANGLYIIDDAGVEIGPVGPLSNYVITPSIAANNLTIAIKNLAGNDPSSSNPLLFRVGNTVYTLAAATSFTKNAGTNWCNLGASELAALPHDLFVYAIGETGAAAGLKFGFSRIPYARTMNDFVNTSTDARYIAGNWTNFNTTDSVVVIGRFRATLSAAAGHNWSIATAVVINQPIYESDWLTWTPTPTGWSSAPTNTVYRYKVNRDTIGLEITQGTNGTSNAAGTTKGLTLPMSARVFTNATWWGTCQVVDNGAIGSTPGLGAIASGGTGIAFYRDWSAGTAWTASGGCRVTGYNTRYAI